MWRRSGDCIVGGVTPETREPPQWHFCLLQRFSHAGDCRPSLRLHISLGIIHTRCRLVGNLTLVEWARLRCSGIPELWLWPATSQPARESRISRVLPSDGVPRESIRSRHPIRERRAQCVAIGIGVQERVFLILMWKIPDRSPAVRRHWGFAPGITLNQTVLSDSCDPEP